MSTVITGVISEFAHPPWGQLHRELGSLVGPGPTTAVLKRIRGPINVDAFGMSWSLFTVPSGYGHAVGVVDNYYDMLAQFGVLFTDLSGHDFYGQMIDVRQDGLYVLFDQQLPTQVDLWVAPGVVLQHYWLVAF